MSVELRTPTATATIASVKLSVQRVSIDIAVGSLPQLQVQVLHGQEAGTVRDGMNFDIASWVEGGQRLIFKDRKNADGHVTVQDGAGNTISFNGFVSAPSFRAGVGNIGMCYALLHESAEMLAYKPSIYTSRCPIEASVGGAGNAARKSLPVIKTGSVAERTLEVLKRRIKNHTDQPLTNVTALTTQVDGKQDETNAGIYPGIEKLLKDSVAATTFAATAKLPEYEHSHITSHVNGILGANSLPTFMDVIEQLCGDFQMMYIPDALTAGSYGRLAKISDAVNGETSGLTISTIEGSWSAGTRSVLPVTHVEVIGQYSSRWRTPTSSDPNQQVIGAPVATIWPSAPYSGGQILSIPGPAWLCESPVDPMLHSSSASSGLDLTVYATKQRAITDYINKITDTVKQDVLQEYAKTHYAFAALAGATASFEIPMDVSLTPGQRYDVSNKSGLKLFTGFLTQVSHELVIQGESASASTVVYFSHIEAGNFTLPYKN